MTSCKGIHIVGFAVAAVLAQRFAFGCVDSAGTEKVWAGTKTAVVKITAAGVGQGCSESGTGFVVSAQGHVLTASHVIPTGCDNLVILVRFEGRADPVSMRVAKRSVHDAVLLETQQRQSPGEYIQIDNSTAPEDSYLEKRVVVDSFYKADTRVTYTACENRRRQDGRQRRR